MPSDTRVTEKSKCLDVLMRLAKCILVIKLLMTALQWISFYAALAHPVSSLITHQSVYRPHVITTSFPCHRTLLAVSYSSRAPMGESTPGAPSFCPSSQRDPVLFCEGSKAAASQRPALFISVVSFTTHSP